MRTLFFLPALLLAAALPAHAAPLYYSFTGVETTGRTDTLTFTVPYPAGYLAQGGVDENVTSLLFNGNALLSSAIFEPVTGYPSESGLEVYGGQFGLVFFGNLFSGYTAPYYNDAVLLTGTFTLDPATSKTIYPFSISTYKYSSGTLIASATPIPAAGVTPEPSSFILLGTGLLATAGSIRRRLTPTRP